MDTTIDWDHIKLEPVWRQVISVFAPDSGPRPVQLQALEQGLLSNRSNFLISAPTNAGKSLVGLLVLLQALQRGQRAVLLEPLRALAREKTDELERLAPALGKLLNHPFKVHISTGDYRLDDERFADPAPGGELIIATPERLEAILRSPKNQPWLDTIGAVCVDEAHLISDSRRGPTLEYLITSLLCLSTPPRLILLSATLGNLDRACEWLAPCEVVRVTERYPPLQKGVLEVAPDQDTDQLIIDWLSEILQNSQSQVLIFVYQTRSAEKLTRTINQALADLAGPEGVQAYHARLSTAQREKARQAFLSGQSRVVITTSALAMGINLPATHVLVRDLSYPGARSPDIGDLLQMMGRAGRGDQAGYAVVVKQPYDDWITDGLRQALEQEELPEFRSVFALDDSRYASQNLPRATNPVAALLSRAAEAGQTRQQLESFFSRSLGGQQLSSQTESALNWLEQHTLAYRSEGSIYQLTVLGQRAVRSVLPLPLAAGFAQLMRDLFTLDSSDQLLSQWKPLDHLLVLNLLHDNTPSLRSFSDKLAHQVIGWCETHSAHIPLLFRDWIRGEKGHSKAIEVLGSLGVSPAKLGNSSDEWARKQGYLATFNTIVLHERGQGQSSQRLEQQFAIKNLEGIEERWRDDMLWLLSGLVRLLEIRTFYYHLREECDADAERIKRIKRLLGVMRRQIYDLQEQLKYCSPLGPLLREIRRTTRSSPGIGVQTIRRLEDSGVTSMKELQHLGFDGLLKKGIRRDIAKKINSYLRRRRQ